MAIKVNLLQREERPKRASAGVSLPKISIGGGLATKGAVGLLVLVLVGLGGMGLMAFWEKKDHEKAVGRLEAQNKALQRQLTEVQAVEAAKREIQRRLDIIGRVAKSQGVPLAMMNGVLRAVPEGLWLTSFEMKPQEVKVRVNATPRPIAYSSSETMTKLEEKRTEATPTGATVTPAAGAAAPTKEVTEIQGYAVVLKGMAFNNFQVAEFMDNLKKAGVFSDVDFNVTQATNVEQVRVMNFEVTATVKL